MSFSVPEIPSLETFPVGGDPGALTLHASALSNASQLLANHGQHINLISTTLTTSWSGNAAEAYHSLSTGIAHAFGAGASTLDSAAGSIFSYAGDLDNFQQQAKIADQQSKDWHEQIVKWTRTVTDDQNALTKAQNDLANAQRAQTVAAHQGPGHAADVSSANAAVNDAQAKVTTAQNNLKHAQEELAQAHQQFNAWQGIARQIHDEASGRGESFGNELTSFTLSPPSLAGDLWGGLKSGWHDIEGAGSDVLHFLGGVGGFLGGLLSSLSRGDLGINDTGHGDIGNNDSGNGDIGTNDSGDGDIGSGDSGDGDIGTNDSGDGDVGSGDSGNGDVGSGDSGNGDVGNGDSGDGDVGDGDVGNGDVGNNDSGNGDVGNNDGGNGDVGDGKDPRSDAERVKQRLQGLENGKSPGVKVVDNEEELEDLFDELSEGGTPVNNSYPGDLERLPDGTTVGIRGTSKSGGETIDIKYPDGSTEKVHVK